MNTPNTRSAPDQDELVLAARAFAHHYRHGLDSAARAQLRRADVPATLGAFHACLARARQSSGRIDETRNVWLLERMVRLQLLDDALPADEPMNMGAYMAAHRSVVKIRRAEALLAADSREQVLEEIARVVSIAGGSLDFGTLLVDLHYFGNTVRRRWAAAYFA